SRYNIDFIEHVEAVERLRRISEIAPVAAGDVGPGGIEKLENTAAMVRSRPILYGMLFVRILRSIARRVFSVVICGERVREGAFGAEPPDAAFQHEDPGCTRSEERRVGKECRSRGRW